MKKIKLFSLLFISTILFVNCSNDDDAMQEIIVEEPTATANTKSYNLSSVADPNISGTVTVTEFSDNSIQLDLNLQNTPSNGVHPAHVHFNTAAEGGDIAVSLEAIDGNTGKSSTNFTTLDDGTAISYSEFLNFDGYVNVHLSPEDLGTLVAQGDIGQNELTGETKTYDLGSVDFQDISGNITFSKRKNGDALAAVNLENTTAGAMYPGHIHMNTAEEGGDIVVTLNPVNGDTGVGKTNIAAFDDGSSFNYEAILVYDGYVNIHLSAEELGTLVAQGNIGSNEGEDENASATSFNVTNTGTTAYIFNGGSFSDANNPELTLKRGETYEFVVNASGHPFFIKTAQGNTNANAYSNGVTNNGAEQGTITFTVPADAPDTLFYNCQFHSSMTAKINITD
ncbi:hypothetical protein [Gillisia sp. JM1]|uniref:hypothetical protein n=1 Tax=Gillisia sp. JM1 TaxID=1283286 RepID=UPI000418726B|nr:hypothetical protein [Gillisia sp. JM1]